MASKNPSGLPSNRQRREARETARQRIEAEASDGRYLERKAYPILWDAQANELLVGTTSWTVIERLNTLFEHTFGLGTLAASDARANDPSPDCFDFAGFPRPFRPFKTHLTARDFEAQPPDSRPPDEE